MDIWDFLLKFFAGVGVVFSFWLSYRLRSRPIFGREKPRHINSSLRDKVLMAVLILGVCFFFLPIWVHFDVFFWAGLALIFVALIGLSIKVTGK
jgi:hypothetical protein